MTTSGAISRFQIPLASAILTPDNSRKASTAMFTRLGSPARVCDTSTRLPVYPSGLARRGLPVRVWAASHFAPKRALLRPFRALFVLFRPFSTPFRVISQIHIATAQIQNTMRKIIEFNGSIRRPPRSSPLRPRTPAPPRHLRGRLLSSLTSRRPPAPAVGNSRRLSGRGV